VAFFLFAPQQDTGGRATPPHNVYGATDALVATPRFMQDRPGAIEELYSD